MMLEHANNLGANCDRLQWVAQEIPDHTDAAGMRKLDQHGEIGAMLPECCMRRMPDPLPAENAAARGDFDPCRIEGVASMADPFGAELPGTAAGAALHQQAVFPQARPIRCRKPIWVTDRNGQPGGKIVRT